MKGKIEGRGWRLLVAFRVWREYSPKCEREGCAAPGEYVIELSGGAEDGKQARLCEDCLGLIALADDDE